MSVLPIDPSALAASGVAPEWQIPSVTPPAEATPGVDAVGGSSESFGDALVQQVSNLSDLQTRAADASQALANGTAADASSVVIAVEKA
ncbi:MAG TPA: flagellar hook-basal body complex protein FliE, partial [Conexibacter sp.]|nr:flagellar hook-basal body complex protein FliE [Conexibacter sp.]